jgi:hypothetical protein
MNDDNNLKKTQLIFFQNSFYVYNKRIYNNEML